MGRYHSLSPQKIFIRKLAMNQPSPETLEHIRTTRRAVINREREERRAEIEHEIRLESMTQRQRELEAELDALDSQDDLAEIIEGVRSRDPEPGDSDFGLVTDESELEDDVEDDDPYAVFDPGAPGAAAAEDREQWAARNPETAAALERLRANHRDELDAQLEDMEAQSEELEAVGRARFEQMQQTLREIKERGGHS
jgi:hypothetical protein